MKNKEKTHIKNKISNLKMLIIGEKLELKDVLTKPYNETYAKYMKNSIKELENTVDYLKNILLTKEQEKNFKEKIAKQEVVDLSNEPFAKKYGRELLIDQLYTSSKDLFLRKTIVFAVEGLRESIFKSLEKEYRINGLEYEFYEESKFSDLTLMKHILNEVEEDIYGIISDGFLSRFIVEELKRLIIEKPQFGGLKMYKLYDKKINTKKDMYFNGLTRKHEIGILKLKTDIVNFEDVKDCWIVSNSWLTPAYPTQSVEKMPSDAKLKEVEVLDISYIYVNKYKLEGYVCGKELYLSRSQSIAITMNRNYDTLIYIDKELDKKHREHIKKKWKEILE